MASKKIDNSPKSKVPVSDLAALLRLQGQRNRVNLAAFKGLVDKGFKGEALIEAYQKQEC